LLPTGSALVILPRVTRTTGPETVTVAADRIGMLYDGGGE
jgi:hypothetical protein